MALVHEVYRLWQRLGAPWHEYLGRAGLDLSDVPIEGFPDALLRPVQVNFRLPGLEDFCRSGYRGIEPGDPARSLLYHVLNSPGVNPKHIRDDQYPTPAEIQTIENYVYGIEAPSLGDLLQRAASGPLAIVVFAYEYSPAADTVHKRHADLVFSRTGIARVGNRPPLYIGKARGFFPYSDDDKSAVHVVPSRYAAFLATTRRGNRATIGPERFQDGDDEMDFWIPLQKLFDGPECIDGFDLQLELTAHHINEKIRKIHLALRNENAANSDSSLSQFPFRITEGLAGFYDPNDPGLLIPDAHDPLVDYARRADGSLVTFHVRRHTPNCDGATRKICTISSALQIPSQFNARSAPEIVHIKHALIDGEIRYLPDNNGVTIEDQVQMGDYEAINFIDYTADGWIAARCPALMAAVPRRLNAYSLLGQPDFFPLVKQQDLFEWWETSAPTEIKENIWADRNGKPLPLSGSRLPANIMLAGAQFDSRDRTITAIVGVDRPAGPAGRIRPFVVRRESTLSYRSTNLFLPGWDCTQDFNRDANSPQGVMHLAHYGLGSPFPEDTMLCAAAGGYWPAAAPDIKRFFPPRRYPSVTPMPDAETGWAGIPLPKWEGGVYSFETVDYADWVKMALERRLHFGQFANETLEHYVGRTLALSRVFQVLGEDTSAKRAQWAVIGFTPASYEEVATALPTRSLGAFTAGNTYRLHMTKLTTPSFNGKFVPSIPTGVAEEFFACAGAVARRNAANGQWNIQEF